MNGRKGRMKGFGFMPMKGLAIVQISGPRATVRVEMKDGIIIGGALLIKKFIGQPIGNLRTWLNSR